MSVNQGERKRELCWPQSPSTQSILPEVGETFSPALFSLSSPPTSGLSSMGPFDPSASLYITITTASTKVTFTTTSIISITIITTSTITRTTTTLITTTPSPAPPSPPPSQHHHHDPHHWVFTVQPQSSKTVSLGGQADKTLREREYRTSCRVDQQAPTMLAPGSGFMEDNFSMDLVGDGLG